MWSLHQGQWSRDVTCRPAGPAGRQEMLVSWTMRGGWRPIRRSRRRGARTEEGSGDREGEPVLDVEADGVGAEEADARVPQGHEAGSVDEDHQQGLDLRGRRGRDAEGPVALDGLRASTEVQLVGVRRRLDRLERESVGHVRAGLAELGVLPGTQRGGVVALTCELRHLVPVGVSEVRPAGAGRKRVGDRGLGGVRVGQVDVPGARNDRSVVLQCHEGSPIARRAR